MDPHNLCTVTWALSLTQSAVFQRICKLFGIVEKAMWCALIPPYRKPGPDAQYDVSGLEITEPVKMVADLPPNNDTQNIPPHCVIQVREQQELSHQFTGGYGKL